MQLSKTDMEALREAYDLLTQGKTKKSKKGIDVLVRAGFINHRIIDGRDAYQVEYRVSGFIQTMALAMQAMEKDTVLTVVKDEDDD